MEDALADVSGEREGNGVDLLRSLQARGKLLVALRPPFQFAGSFPINVLGEQEWNRDPVPQVGERCADAGIVANQTDGDDIHLVADERRHSGLLAIDVQRAIEAVWVKCAYGKRARKNITAAGIAPVSELCYALHSENLSTVEE
jgi:hypothetical protein